jgi:hypothetical protein
MFYDNHSAGLKLESGGHTERHTHAGALTDSMAVLQAILFSSETRKVG